MDYKDADTLLWKWWLYTRRRDSRDKSSVSGLYGQGKSSRQWDDTSQIADTYAHTAMLRQIDWDVMPALEPKNRAAICFEMRNREAARVWRVDGDYGAALKAVDGVMRDKGVL